MKLNRKRRWLLAVGAASVPVLLVVALIYESNDTPRATVERYFLSNGTPTVTLRLDAPGGRAMRAIQATLKAVEVEGEEQSVFWVRKGSERGQEIRLGHGVTVTPPLMVRAGASMQLDLVLPRRIWSNGQWRMVVLVEVPSAGLSVWKKRVSLCWRGKTLSPVLDKWAFVDTAMLWTDPITNPALSTMDAPVR